MKRKGKLPFDPTAFLSKVNGGRTITGYRKGNIVFSQGGVADAVFYIQKGKIKLSDIRPSIGLQTSELQVCEKK